MRSNDATPLSSQATASPSMMQERERRRPRRVRATARHRRRPLLGLSHHRWSRVLVPGTAREAKERAVLGSRDHPFRAPDGGPAPGRNRDRALRAALPPRGCATGETGDRRGNASGMARDRRRPVARVHLLLAGVGGGRPAATADAKGKPPAWPLALLPLGLYPPRWI